jgi:hypothetical protein
LSKECQKQERTREEEEEEEGGKYIIKILFL